MRKLAALVVAASLCAGGAGAQVRVDGTGVSAGDVRVDSTGVHTGTTSVTGRGVSVGRGSGTIVNGNGQTRRIDCGGGALTVNGNSNHLTIARCARVLIAGNSNVADVSFGQSGSLSVPGNRNALVVHAARGVRLSTSLLGARNSLVRR